MLKNIVSEARCRSILASWEKSAIDGFALRDVVFDRKVAQANAVAPKKFQ
jgi:hypothetical protein